MTPGCTAIPGGAVPTRSTTIPDHIGQPAKPQRHIPNQTQPAVFWRAFACALAGCTAKVRARQAAFGEVCRPLPYPQSARLLPRLACALNRPLIVRFVQTAQAPPVLALRSKNDVSKIVQICAHFCIKTHSGWGGDSATRFRGLLSTPRQQYRDLRYEKLTT